MKIRTRDGCQEETRNFIPRSRPFDNDMVHWPCRVIGVGPSKLLLYGADAGREICRQSERYVPEIGHVEGERFGVRVSSKHE